MKRAKRIIGLILISTSVLSFNVSANELKSTNKNPNIIQNNVEQDSPETDKVVTSKEGGKVIYNITHKSGTKERIIVDLENDVLEDYDSTSGQTTKEKVSSIVKIDNTNTNLMNKQIIKQNITKPGIMLYSSNDYADWQFKKCFPKANLEAEGRRVTAVCSGFATALAIPYPLALGMIRNMYTAATGKSLPSIFEYFCNNWYVETNIYYDLHNFSNLKAVYLYWWQNNYRGYQTQYCKES